MEGIHTVFLDRDGVINRMRPEYVLSWEAFEFLPRAKDAVRLLNAAGMRVVLVTNQRAVARGLLSETDLTRIHENMCAGLAAADAKLDAIYYCPHDKGVCDCRKPQVGMFLRAQRDFPDIDFRRSVVVGDGLVDMQAGAQLGCRLVYITDPGSPDHADEDPTAVRLAGISLYGCAPTLYDAVTNHILPGASRSVHTATSQES